VLLQVPYAFVDCGGAGVFEKGHVGYIFADLSGRLGLFGSEKVEYGAMQLSPSYAVCPKSYALFLFQRQSFQLPLQVGEQTVGDGACLFHYLRFQRAFCARQNFFTCKNALGKTFLETLFMQKLVFDGAEKRSWLFSSVF
jgi:hypothetical protein